MTTLRVHNFGASMVEASGTLRVHRFSTSAIPLSPIQLNFLRVHRFGVQLLTPNRSPVVSIDKTALTIDSGDPFVLTGYDSDPDGTIVLRRWTRDGQVVGTDSILRIAQGPVVPFDTAVTYTYTATDDDGLATSTSAVVTVRRAPVVVRNPNGALSGRVYRTFTAAEVTAMNGG